MYIVTKKQLEKTICLIASEPELQPLTDTLANIAKNADDANRNEIDLIDLNNHIATCTWLKDDIANDLEEEGYATITDNINAVLSEIDRSDMESEMIVAGWDYIHAARKRADKQNKLIK